MRLLKFVISALILAVMLAGLLGCTHNSGHAEEIHPLCRNYADRQSYIIHFDIA